MSKKLLKLGDFISIKNVKFGAEKYQTVELAIQQDQEN
jgi:hypothetical protein